MALKIGIGRILIRGGGSTPWSYLNNLALHYTERSALDILETQSGSSLNAKILPSLGVCDASNYLKRTQANFGGADATGFMEWTGEVLAVDSTIYMLCAGDLASSWGFFQIALRGGYPSVWCANGGGAIYHRVQTKQKVPVGLHTIRLEGNGVAWKFFIDGVEDVSGWTVSSGSNAGLWFSVCNGAADNVTIGCFQNVTTTYTGTAHNVISVNYNDTHKWVVTGTGDYAYDTVGNYNMTWMGAAHITYSLNGSQELLDSGYTLYTKAGEDNEYVPTGATPPATYALYSTHVGSATAFNGSPCLIDFDYTDSGNANLVVFKKDNNTIFIATGSMSYYDATNVYRWRQDEILDPRIYSDTYKNAGYKGMVMNKALVTSGIVLDAKEILAYSADNTGNTEWSLAKYCLLDDIVTKVGGVAVYDADNYIIWV